MGNREKPTPKATRGDIAKKKGQARRGLTKVTVQLVKIFISVVKCMVHKL